MQDWDAEAERTTTRPGPRRTNLIRLGGVIVVLVLIAIRMGATLRHTDPPPADLDQQQLNQVAGQLLSHAGATATNPDADNLSRTDTLHLQSIAGLMDVTPDLVAKRDDACSPDPVIMVPLTVVGVQDGPDWDPSALVVVDRDSRRFHAVSTCINGLRAENELAPGERLTGELGFAATSAVWLEYVSTNGQTVGRWRLS